ncbi:MAG: hypothetical protein M1821_000620 [Bathelium mastoideum]|nr:MAG: hypothetical protein M1821_000620 [Bathelium mastoideum]
MAPEESSSNDFRKLRIQTNSPIRPPPSPFAALAHDDPVDEGSQETIKPTKEIKGTPVEDGLQQSRHPARYGSMDSNAVTSSSGSPDGSVRARTSISFNDTMRLDDGRLHTLHEPLAKKKGRSRSRGRSIMQELAQKHSNSGGAAEALGYDGQLKDNAYASEAVSFHGTAKTGANGNHVLQSSVDKLSQQDEEEVKEYDKVASLTSDSSISPSVDEVKTPVDTIPQMDSLPSPVTTMSPSYTTNMPTGPIPMPMLRRDSSAYSKADPSRPRSIRRDSRRHSRRSTSNSTSKSPASAFLSQWGKGAEEAAALAEPDDEGQEIGDHSKYIIGREIDRGGFSSVKEVFTMEDDVRIRRAVKIVRKRVPGASESENEKMQAKFEHEVSVWRYLRHRHILSLLAVYDTPFATFCITRLNQGGTLFDVVRSSRRNARRGLSAPLATRYLAQLAFSLRYLHEDVHMVHRDVKLENCLIDMTSSSAQAGRGGTLQLCDFGMADFLTDDAQGVSDIAGAVQAHETSSGTNGRAGSGVDASVVLGSLEYASPEGLASQGIPMFVTTGDIWAFGVIAYTVLVGDLPFRHEFWPKLQSQILGGEWDVQAVQNALAVEEIEDGTGKAEELVRGCLTVSTSDRWSITDVVSSRWLKEYEDSDEEADQGWD